MPPWSSQLAADLRDEHVQLLFAFLELRARLRKIDESAFAGGAAERARLLDETETDYVALASAGAAAARLEAVLDAADREATQREVDSGAVILEQLRELVGALSRRLP
jgi:hypothetical protein